MTVLQQPLIEQSKQEHRDSFPLTDNLMSVAFLAQVDLNDQQRERFVSSMSLRNIGMRDYTHLGVKQLFMEVMIRQRSTFQDWNY